MNNAGFGGFEAHDIIFVLNERKIEIVHGGSESIIIISILRNEIVFMLNKIWYVNGLLHWYEFLTESYSA